MKRVLLMLFVLFLSVTTLTACGNMEEEKSEPYEFISKDKEETKQGTKDIDRTVDTEDVEDSSEVNYEDEDNSYIDDMTPREKMIVSLVDMIDEGNAFDVGSYIKEDIPEGEYAFVTFDGSGNYYSEENESGEIIENENFTSYGYVYVHSIGNLTTHGVLVSIDSLEDLGVTGSKELYEILNGEEDYKGSGWYKVGIDIEPGEYVLESTGKGYMAVMSGPVGKSDIISNDIFDGRHTVNVQEGQYLNINGANITE